MKLKEYKKQMFIVLGILCTLVIFGLTYMTYMLDKIEANASNSIKTIVRNDASNLSKEIEDQKAILESITNKIISDNTINKEEIFEMYQKSDITSKFIRMAIMYEDGSTITNDGYKVDYSDEKENFFSNNKIHVSENRISKINGEEINIYSKSLEVDGEKIAILLIVTTESYKDIFSNKIFEGKGFSYIVDKTGVIVVNANRKVKNGNLIEVIKQILKSGEKEKFVSIQNTINNNLKNDFSGENILETIYGKYYMVYEPIGANEWTIFTFIPSSAIASEANRALLTTFIISIIVILVFVSICIYIIIANNIKQKQLYQYAYIDSVTQKGNVYFFREKGQEILEKNISDLYIFILDINKFKMINKAYGYKIGNNILFGIGEELQKIFAYNNSLVCRYSNDFFAVLFQSNKSINNMLNKVIKNIEKLNINDNLYNLSINIGVYKIKKEDTDITQVIDKALIAHSISKGNMFDKYHIYDEKIEKEIEEESKIESEMNKALIAKEFNVYYQPKIYTNTEKIYGAEALVRWEHNGELIPPNKFIPLFEKNRFILKLDLYIFEQVCKDMKMWKEKYRKEPVISVNVSRQHFMEEKFLEEYTMITGKYGINPNNIDLEITESAAANDGIDIIEIMEKMKRLGFLISIDDFGTGYSSLSMLQDMPADIIKIDKSFVDKIGKNENNIVDYILNIAKELKIKTIAEGVETKEQKEYLLEKGCDIIQGYYYSKPLQKDEFEKYFNSKK